MSSDDFFNRNIIVTGFPQNVTPDKRERFMRHTERKFATVLGHSRFSVYLVMDRETNVVSAAFLTFATESDAEAALAKLNLYRFTQADVLHTYRWSALRNVTEDEGPYVPPELPSESDAKDDFAHTMAEDAEARPQFIVKGGVGLDCEWYMFDWERNEPVLLRRPSLRKGDAVRAWSDEDRKAKELKSGLVSSLQPGVRPLPVWSTYGTMVISQQANGLRVCGGRTMQQLFELNGDIEAFMVSSCEKYIVVKTANDLSVLNLRTAKRIRTLGNLDLHSDDLWPITRFSADDSLIAVCKTGYSAEQPNEVAIGKLYIYVAETMRVLQGNQREPAPYTFAIPGLYKAEWNPAVKTQIAHVSSLGTNQGWKVVIANVLVDEDNIASEEVLIQRNFMQTERLDMLWHPAGTHLAVKVQHQKSIEYFLFHIGARSVAVVQMQIKAGYSAARFAWQPAGDYFAIVLEKIGASTLGDNGLLQIYSLRNNKRKLLKEMVTATTNLFWSPRGARLVAASFDKSILHFIAINEFDAVTEHDKLTGVYVTDCQWDPTGRFFAAWVSSLRNTTMASQYRIYDYNGNELYAKAMQPFSHVAWRPLPPSMLDDDDVREVRESLKLLVDDYEAAHASRLEEEQARLAKQRTEQEAVFVKRMKEVARRAHEHGLAATRAQLESSSRWARYWPARLKALPEAERRTHDTIVEERVVSRRQLGAPGARAN